MERICWGYMGMEGLYGEGILSKEYMGMIGDPDLEFGCEKAA